MVALAGLLVKLQEERRIKSRHGDRMRLFFEVYSQCAEHTASKNQVGYGPQGCQIHFTFPPLFWRRHVHGARRRGRISYKKGC